MAFWEIDISAGRFFLDFAWLGSLLLAGFFIRYNISFFRRYLIPANLLAGILGLIIGINGFGLIDLTSERLGVYVYHLLALLFIGLSLRATRKKIGLSSVKIGMLFIITYLIQGIIGLLITFALIYTFIPDLFAGIGLLPPLAFGMNPGIAYTIGTNWEQFGFASGGIVGLTFSACGFLVAYTFGIWLVRRGIKKGRATYIKTDEELPDEVKKGILDEPKSNEDEKITTSPENIESFSFHIGLIGFTFILTYLVVTLMEWGLISAGAENEVTTLWSFHFIIAAIVALFVRKIMDTTKASRV